MVRTIRRIGGLAHDFTIFLKDNLVQEKITVSRRCFICLKSTRYIQTLLITCEILVH